MSALVQLHHAKVTPEEIDHLGHMNVRFYLAKALCATDVLAQRLGLGEESCRERGAELRLRHVFTRHYREQLEGAELVVKGGVHEVRADGLRLYHELWNPARDELSATFLHDVALLDRETRAPLPLPEGVGQSAMQSRVAWPEQGRPRTMDLASDPPALALAEARKRGLAMRKERTVLPGSCDANGAHLESHYQDLFWGGEPVQPRSTEDPLYTLPGGAKMGWATLESRGILHALPRGGTRIQSFGAEVALAGKTSYQHHWVYDLETEAIVCTSSIVNLAFDVTNRRAIEIPDFVRETLEGRYHPDLR